MSEANLSRFEAHWGEAEMNTSNGAAWRTKTDIVAALDRANAILESEAQTVGVYSARREIEVCANALRRINADEWTKQAALKVKNLVISATLKGVQIGKGGISEEDRITDADVDALEAALLAHLDAAIDAARTNDNRSGGRRDE